MRTYKITVSYDGTNYHGWQIQNNNLTVAQVLQDAYATVFGTPISLVGVSRTDAGVHARGQVAVFKAAHTIDPKSLLCAWNNALPDDIVIRCVEHVADNYNPHQNIAQKIYRYHFYTERPLPFLARYGVYIRKSISLEVLQQALDLFVGTHDFRSFSTGDERGNDTIRSIDAISICRIKRYNAYAITVKGPKFLRYMIRRIVGAALDCAVRSDSSRIEELKKVFAQKNPRHTFPNAPAKGLMLYKVVYAHNNNV